MIGKFKRITVDPDEHGKTQQVDLMQCHKDTDSKSTISYIEASDDEVDNDEITFEIHSDEESATQKSGKKPNTKEIMAKNS